MFFPQFTFYSVILFISKFRMNVSKGSTLERGHSSIIFNEKFSKRVGKGLSMSRGGVPCYN